MASGNRPAPGGRAPPSYYITVLELIAVLRNMQAFAPRLASRTVRLHEDNMAVCYILRRKITRSPVLMAELRKLWAFAEQHEIALRTVSYVRSEDNPADAPSRLAGGDSWMVRREVFGCVVYGAGAQVHRRNGGVD